MMRRVTETELARTPVQALASARGVSAPAIAAEVLVAFAREHLDALDDSACRALEHAFWRAWTARNASP